MIIVERPASGTKAAPGGPTMKRSSPASASFQSFQRLAGVSGHSAPPSRAVGGRLSQKARAMTASGKSASAGVPSSSAARYRSPAFFIIRTVKAFGCELSAAFALRAPRQLFFGKEF